MAGKISQAWSRPSRDFVLGLATPLWRLPDILVTVHVHRVKLLHLFLALIFLHVLQHFISYVLGQNGKHQPLLKRGNREQKEVEH